MPSIRYHQHMLDVDPLPTAVTSYVEGHQFTKDHREKNGKYIRNILRYGNDLVDLSELEAAETSDLALGLTIQTLGQDKRPLFYGSSSPASLVRKTIDYTHAFAKTPMRSPSFQPTRLCSWEEFAVRDSVTYRNVCCRPELSTEMSTGTISLLRVGFRVS
jgi:hypothetical protein